MPKVHHDRLTRSQWALFVRIVFNSKWLPHLMGGFSRWQFVVLGRKTQVFSTVNQKNNF